MSARPDLEPGFWCEYQPPASFVAAEVQKPSHLINGETLAVAYMRDWRASRTAIRTYREANDASQ